MAWEKIFDDTMPFGYNPNLNGLTGTKNNFENTPDNPPSKIKITIADKIDEELPVYSGTEASGSSYGELDNESMPVFSTYNSAVMFYSENGTDRLSVAFSGTSTDEGSYRVQIYIPEDDPEPSKKSTTLGVKEAMKHYVSTTEIAEPATTIKKLTKQIMSNLVGEDENIEKARTIAEIYEAAAIKNGYVPEESTSGTSTPIPAVDPSNPDPGTVVAH